MMKKISFIGIVAVAFTLFMSASYSCHRGDIKAPPVDNATIVDSGLSCATDADCTVVKDGCCGCNQAGKQRAITVSGSQAWLTNLQGQCADTMCAQMISRDETCGKKAACVKQRCELQ